MARYRRKMALYEVINRTRLNSSSDKPLESLPTEGNAAETPPPSGFAKWPTKPRMLQINAGRVEVTLPYQLAIAILLGIVLLILVAFRFGQMASQPQAADTIAAKPQVLRAKAVTTAPKSARSLTPPVKSPAPAESQGTNNIVIKQFGGRADLEPAKAYFDGKGIETEIVKYGNTYFLRTVNKYNNPGNQGTNGYKALQRIKAVGGKYKAPSGYETFGTKPFQDAYGKRFTE